MSRLFDTDYNLMRLTVFVWLRHPAISSTAVVNAFYYNIASRLNVHVVANNILMSHNHASGTQCLAHNMTGEIISNLKLTLLWVTPLIKMDAIRI